MTTASPIMLRVANIRTSSTSTSGERVIRGFWHPAPMRAVVQRARGASVTVDGSVVGAFEGPGLLVLLGVQRRERVARTLALNEALIRKAAQEMRQRRSLKPDSLRKR